MRRPSLEDAARVLSFIALGSLLTLGLGVSVAGVVYAITEASR